MFSIDTNILFHAFNEDSPSHEAAYGWLTSIQHEEEVVLAGFFAPDPAKELKPHISWPTGGNGCPISFSLPDRS